MQRYDLLVIGSGPSGQRAAIQASKSGEKVALIEKTEELYVAGSRHQATQ